VGENVESHVPEYIETRLRQCPPKGLPVVRGSTPVVAFGDARKAKVATLGWNPSKVEFLDRNGKELTGKDRRLETLSSLGERDLPSASPDAIRRVFEGCNDYFQRCPYRKWFDVLEKILRPLGASYYTGAACHLDLVQWATDPTWGKLRSTLRKNFIEEDLSFLQKQLSRECIRLLLLNGRGVVNAYTWNVGCQLAEKVIPGKAGWKVFVGKTSQGTKVIGWNKNLQSSFGVSNDYIKAVSAAIADAGVYG
jgi:hypothetical protein